MHKTSTDLENSPAILWKIKTILSVTEKVKTCLELQSYKEEILLNCSPSFRNILFFVVWFGLFLRVFGVVCFCWFVSLFLLPLWISSLMGKQLDDFLIQDKQKGKWDYPDTETISPAQAHVCTNSIFQIYFNFDLKTPGWHTGSLSSWKCRSAALATHKFCS